MPRATHIFKNVNVKSRQAVPAFCHLKHHRFDFLKVFYTTLFDLLREGSGNPLQYSCLENPGDRARWAAVYGVAQSRTQQQHLTSCLLRVSQARASLPKDAGRSAEPRPALGKSGCDSPMQQCHLVVRECHFRPGSQEYRDGGVQEGATFSFWFQVPGTP